MKFSEFKKNIDDGLKNTLTEDESSDRVKNLEAILNIVNTINRSLILEDVLELVLKNAIRLTNSERGFIVLQNSQGKLVESSHKEDRSGFERRRFDPQVTAYQFVTDRSDDEQTVAQPGIVNLAILSALRNPDGTWCRDPWLGW